MEKNVLIVDDDPFQQLRLSAMFKFMSSQHGLEIRTFLASNLDEAYEALYDREKEKPFDLVLADICLGADEYAFNLRSACERKYPKTAFVFTSGQLSEEAFRDSYYRRKSIPFISKDVNPSGYMKELEDRLFAD
jgi:DNA-binding LytR/AlgR family response regulator